MSIRRLLLLAFVLIAVALLLTGNFPGLTTSLIPSRQPVGSSESVERARERGAELGESAARAAAKFKETANEAALTAKIKAKMALDDAVKARTIGVTTQGTTVTLSGTVESRAEHDRAMSLARETAGVTTVVDDLHTR
jgi:hyperosmotically inducible protein